MQGCCAVRAPGGSAHMQYQPGGLQEPTALKAAKQLNVDTGQIMKPPIPGCPCPETKDRWNGTIPPNFERDCNAHCMFGMVAFPSTPTVQWQWMLVLAGLAELRTESVAMN
jgi:hypothetical protein|mmetsp:Transcript_52304/g.85934  ORF Transcript_52304/g.85934 Transcript_52304/m.85934 type:complete len:111 (+) Transcript_52304:1139-1471(+)